MEENTWTYHPVSADYQMHGDAAIVSDICHPVWQDRELEPFGEKQARYGVTFMVGPYSAYHQG